MNKNFVLDLGYRHDIINTFERSFSSVLNKRRLFQLGMIASDERKTSMVSRMDWFPEEEEPLQKPIRDHGEQISNGAWNGFHDDRRWYSKERRIEREYDRLDARYLAGGMTDEDYISSIEEAALS